MKLLFYFLSICLVFISCKRENGGSSCDLNRESIIGEYGLFDYKETYLGKTYGMETVKECEKDNIWLFAPTDYFYLKDVGISCNGNDASGWSLIGDQLNFLGERFTVKSFDCKDIVLELPADSVRIVLRKK